MIGKAVWDIIRPAFIAIGEIFSGVANFFKSLSEASSWSDAASIIGKAFYDAGIYLKDKLFMLFESLINKLLRLLPKRLGGYSSGEVVAQESLSKILDKQLGLEGASENDAVRLAKLIRKIQEDKIDLSKLKTEKELYDTLGDNYKNLDRMAKTDVKKKLLLSTVQELSSREFKDLSGEGQEQLAEVFRTVGSDLEKALKDKGKKLSPDAWKKIDSIVPKRPPTP